MSDFFWVLHHNAPQPKMYTSHWWKWGRWSPFDEFFMRLPFCFSRMRFFPSLPWSLIFDFSCFFFPSSAYQDHLTYAFATCFDHFLSRMSISSSPHSLLIFLSDIKHVMGGNKLPCIVEDSPCRVQIVFYLLVISNLYPHKEASNRDFLF